jgi:metallo-beta-lactamase family protein
LFSLERLHERGLAPRVPIYIDSPLAIAITEIYKLHPEGLSPDVRQRMRQRDDPFSPPGVHYVAQIADSRRLQASAEPCIIIAGSGMCEGGRILHHFTHALAQEKNSVVIVGFMAQHTLGRRLLEGRARVKVFGVERDVRASIHALGGLSAHAGQRDLVAFADATARAGALGQVLLVHGEPAARASLAARLAERLQVPVLRPVRGQTVPL